MKIEYASELMKNQKHAVVMAPTAQFEVLQSQQGDALFFSIGTDGVFYCTREAQQTAQGWVRADLSSVLSSQLGGASVAVKLFDVSQNGQTGLIDVALAVSAGGEDHLVLARGNPDTLDFWSSPPQWQIVAYDDPAHPGLRLAIADLYLTPGSTEYVVVDVVSTPGQPIAEIARYFIDPTLQVTGRAWNPHPLPSDLQAGSIQSSLGRKAGQLVDGLYTLGAILSETELIYTALFNEFDPRVPPPPSRIVLPGGAAPDATALALAANPDATTNLFLAASGSLYFLASSAQHDGATPALVCSHPLLTGVRALHADVGGVDVLLWGVNAQGTLFCLRNARGSELTAAWSVPVPLLQGVGQVATYLNRVGENRVIFAQTGEDTLVRLTENPETTLWERHDILLPPTNVNDVVEHSTYTTHVQINQDNNLAAAGQAVSISSSTACDAYINNQYFRLDITTPVTAHSDASGALTIVQDVSGIDAAYYNLSLDSETINVNPTANVLEKLSAVSSGSDLDVTLTDEKGQQQPLLGPQVTDRQKQDTAAAIKQFVSIAGTMPQDGSVKPPSSSKAGPLTFDPARHLIFGVDYRQDGGYFDGVEGARRYGLAFDQGGVALARPGDLATDPLDSIASTAGDVFKWIEEEIDDVSDFFVTVAEGVATFFVRIADQFYHFVIDCVNDAIRGIEFVLHKIEVLIETLIMWLGFLFGWGDIVRTHRALKNLLRQYAQHNVDELGTVKAALQQAFTQVKQEIDSWAGLPAMPSSIGAMSQSASPLPSQNSPQAHWGVYHFKNGAPDSVSSYQPSNPDTDPIETVLAELLGAIENEEQVLLHAVQELKSQVIDRLGEASVTEIIEKIAAILLDAVLETAEDVLIALLDIVAVLIAGAIDLLDATIEIPILSWIYKLLVGDDLSLLDLLCLVAAIPVTIVFKAAKDRAPFPDDAFTAALIDAPDFASIQRLYADAETIPQASGDLAAGAYNPQSLDDLTYGCNITGFIGSIALTAANVWKYNSPESAWAAFIGGACYFPYVAPNVPAMVKPAAQQTWYDEMNTVVTVMSTAKTLVDVSLYKNKAGRDDWIASWGKISPACECLINAVWEVPVVAGLVASAKTDDDYMSFGANTAFNLGGVIAPGAAYPKDPETKLGFLVGMSFCSISYGGLLLALDLVPTGS